MNMNIYIYICILLFEFMIKGYWREVHMLRGKGHSIFVLGAIISRLKSECHSVMENGKWLHFFKDIVLHLLHSMSL